VRAVRLGADLPISRWAAGAWSRSAIRRGENTFAFAHPYDEFTVEGPQLAAESLAVTPGAEGLRIELGRDNVGTATADPQEIEVWGWQPGDERPFTVRQALTASLEPGASTTLEFQVPTAGSAGLWRVVGAGYWRDGDYYTVPLPQQPAVTVAAETSGDTTYPAPTAEATLAGGETPAP
jgi:hypothetical protein